MTYLDRLNFAADYPDTTGWRTRHVSAIVAPVKAERPIVHMLKAWLEYADTHEAAYETRIGDDYVLGPQWAAIGGAMLALLNGDLGRLDGGTLDGIIRDTLSAEGFNPDEL